MWWIHVTMLFTHERNQVIAHATWMDLEDMMRTDTEDHVLYDSMSMEHPEQANPWRQGL